MEYFFILLTVFSFFDILKANPINSFGKCVTPDKKEGSCIFLENCTLLTSLMSEEILTTEQINLLTQSQCGFSHESTLVCCPNNEQSLLPKPGECGVSLGFKSDDGSSSPIDQHPWMALLQYYTPNNDKIFECVGVLINKRYVLTAAHCIYGEKESNLVLSAVRLGQWSVTGMNFCEYDYFDTDCEFEPYPTIDVSIEELVVHDGYIPYSSNQLNDIALLRLMDNVSFNEIISPICLPEEDHFNLGEKIDFPTLVVGWSHGIEGLIENPDRGNIVGAELVPCNDQEELEQEIDETEENQFCIVEDENSDVCIANSAGPLVGLNGQFYCYGIESLGPKFCGWPIVYTKVSKYVDWIKSKIRP